MAPLLPPTVWGDAVRQARDLQCEGLSKRGVRQWVLALQRTITPASVYCLFNITCTKTKTEGQMK